MAAAVEVVYDLKALINETIGLGLDSVTDPTVKHEISGMGATLNASSSVKVSKAWSDQVQLSSGAATLDLTALVVGSANLSNLDLTGLGVQVLAFKAASTNTADVTIAVGATNGYDILGASDGKLSIPPGAKGVIVFENGLQDVAAGDKDVDLASSDTDAIIDILLAAGATS